MIFWKHIKGLSSNNIYTFLRFSNVAAGGDLDNKDITRLPKIYTFNSTDFDAQQATSYGYILTSDMVNGYITSDFTFKGGLTIHHDANTEIVLSFTNSQWKLDNTHDFYITKGIVINETAKINSTTDASTSVATAGALQVSGGVGIAKKLYVGGVTTIKDKCEATYFNAVSDYRAKKDFKLLDIDALELIKKVRLYSFNYKDSNQPSIGIIAQDVQDININGFDLVDNKTATGENFDYMSIHESKLIYILWKAIQEQQKEIEELKLQLNK